MKIRIAHRGATIDLEVAGDARGRDVRFEDDGRTVRHQVVPIARSGYGGTALVDGRPVRYLAERDGERLRIALGGESFDFDLGEAAAGRRAGHATASPETRSPMPGKVLQLAAEVGATVQPGDPLLILEAMKMENVLVAELAGTVAEVHVAVGDMVEPGKLLVVIRPDEPS